jgi:hypothetical protein
MKTLADYAYEGAPDPLASVSFVRYDPATGEIVMAGTLQRIILDNHLEADDPILEGQGQPETHRVDLATKTIVEGANTTKPEETEDPQMELPL